MNMPPNPYGTCFDATAHNFLANKDEPTLRVCHGVGIANKPDELGNTIGHAWLEFERDGVKIALDCNWLVFQPAERYRKMLQMSYVVEYDAQQFMDMWMKTDFPGPWDAKVMAHVNP